MDHAAEDQNSLSETSSGLPEAQCCVFVHVAQCQTSNLSKPKSKIVFRKLFANGRFARGKNQTDCARPATFVGSSPVPSTAIKVDLTNPELFPNSLISSSNCVLQSTHIPR
ncbi:hypothetical protein L596_013431 [Steinernema carpocapsae]|uniref:Uncharacterized protein n=1 Tax=Steinernema carpocapsae TaxID=34508 RepID=A0A4V6A533_STECR|nr:hypothetical protein L596_013431 [Steinernema carpocapsae]